MVDITGLDRREVLVALWENSHSQGISFLGAFSSKLTIEDAEKVLEHGGGYCDYVNGRVIKCDLPDGATSFNPWGYDRDNGKGAAQKVIDELRAKYK